MLLFAVSKFLLTILLSVVLSSCGSKTFENEADLWAYIKDPDNGYLQEKTVNGVHFSLLYKPTDLMVAQEIRNTNGNAQIIDSLRGKYGQYTYFNLTMSRGNQELLNSVAGDRNKFGSMANRLLFGMKTYIHLYSNSRDTIKMIDYVYPRMYGLSKNTSLLLVYPKEEIEGSQEINMSIKDLGFGTGDISFKYDQSLLKKNPHINFN